MLPHAPFTFTDTAKAPGMGIPKILKDLLVKFVKLRVGGVKISPTFIISCQEMDRYGRYLTTKTHRTMVVKDKQTYSAPEVAVLEIKSEGVICTSLTLNPVTLGEEEVW